MARRIVILTAEYPPYGGGAGVIAHSLLLSLSEVQGCKVKVVRLPFGGRVRWLGYIYYILDFVFSLLFFRPTLIVLNDQISALFGLFVSFVGVKYIVLSHGSENQAMFSKLTRVKSIFHVDRLYFAAVKRAEAYIVPSKLQRDKMQLTPVGVFSEKFRVLPWGVSNTEACAFEFRGNCGRAGMNGVNILLCSRLISGKGVADFLLEFVKNADALNKTVLITVVGSGPDEYKIKCLKNNNMERKLEIELTGWVSNDSVHKYYKDADIFIHSSSLPESYGLTFQDALISGLKVFALDSGALSEFDAGEQVSFHADFQSMSVDVMRYINERSEFMGYGSQSELLVHARRKLVDYLACLSLV